MRVQLVDDPDEAVVVLHPALEELVVLGETVLVYNKGQHQQLAVVALLLALGAVVPPLAVVVVALRIYVGQIVQNQAVVIPEQLLRPAGEVLHQPLAHIVEADGTLVETVLRDPVHVVARQAADVRVGLYPLRRGILRGGVDGADGYLRQGQRRLLIGESELAEGLAHLQFLHRLHAQVLGAYLKRPQVLHGRRVGDEAALMLAAATVNIRFSRTVPAGNVYLAKGYQLRIHTVGHHANLLAVLLLVERRLRLAVGTVGHDVGHLTHLPYVEVIMAAQVQQLVAHGKTLRVAPAAAEDVVDVPLAVFRRPFFRLHEHGRKGRHSV